MQTAALPGSLTETEIQMNKDMYKPTSIKIKSKIGSSPLFSGQNSVSLKKVLDVCFEK